MDEKASQEDQSNLDIWALNLRDEPCLEHKPTWAAHTIADEVLDSGRPAPGKTNIDKLKPTMPDLAGAVEKASETIVSRCKIILEKGPASLKEKAKVLKVKYEKRVEFEDDVAEDESISMTELLEIYLKCMEDAKETWNWREMRDD
jgi:hypothetical protein